MLPLAFIINPRAGTDRVKELRQIITTHLDAQKFEAEILFTQHAGHGTELARKAALDGAFAVVAVGGDGSVNDVATGLLGAAAHLAIIPKGSGNGMARNLDTNRIPDIARNMAVLIERQCGEAGSQTREIQIDCDWTGRTKDAYFTLLRALKSQPFFKQKILSATIRLHQIKYVQRSGIPPADRGLLMCYNMGDLRKAGARNSILDPGVARQYLGGVGAYPLPLDMALPLFRWCLLFDGPQFKGIVREATPETVAACPVFEKQNAYEYRCLRDTIWYGTALKKGMTIRPEFSDPSDIQEMTAFIASRLPASPLSVVLYHADSLTLQPFSDETLDDIYRACE